MGKPAITVGVVEGLVVFAYVLVFTFLWRMAATKLADKPIGRAMAAVYS
jgi:hypothetical protein